MMMTIETNQEKRIKAIKQITRIRAKSSKGFVKFCYCLTWLLRMIAIIFGTGTILFYIFSGWSQIVIIDFLITFVIPFALSMLPAAVYLKEPWFDLLYLIITFVFPFGLSMLPAAVYLTSASGEYGLRRNETISFCDGGFTYSYQDARALSADAFFAFKVLYDNINNYKYEYKTNILTLQGVILGSVYINGELKETDEYCEISFLDVYDISIRKLLKENNVQSPSQP